MNVMIILIIILVIILVVCAITFLGMLVANKLLSEFYEDWRFR